jgi:hypothetical protein
MSHRPQEQSSFMHRPLWKHPAFWIALLVMGGSSLALSAAVNYFQIYLKKLPIYPPQGRLVTALPTESHSFVRIGTDQVMGKEIEEVLGTTNYLSRFYREKGNAPEKQPRILQLHLAYYTGMIDTVPHVPDRCMVGAGMDRKGEIVEVPIPFDTSRWTPDDHVPAHLRGQIYRARTSNNLDEKNNFVNYTDLQSVPFRLPRNPGDIKLRAMKFADPSGENERWAGYFFIANGGAVSQAEEVRLLAFDLRSTYAYYLKVEFQSEQVKSAEELAALAGKFLDENFAEIMRCLPDWVEVEEGRYPPNAGTAQTSYILPREHGVESGRA